MEAALDDRLIPRGDVTKQPLGEGGLLVDMRSGDCFELNRTGAEVWDLLANGATMRSIAATLSAKYGLPGETIATDVRLIVDALLRQKLVQLGPPIAEFAQRYLLARYDTGGVVIDLASGNYFRVNRTAAMVCEALLHASERTAAAARVAAQLNVGVSEASAVVDEVFAGLNVPVSRGEPEGSYHFFPTASGYELRHGQNRVLEVSGDGSRVQIAAGAPPVTETQLELYVRALAPKLLFQNDVGVLHASSCVVHGKLIAFAGLSRAGKTTTARAFASAGATLVSEDLLVRPSSDDPAVVLNDGEQRVHDWARAITSRLLRDRDEAVSTESLVAEVVQGTTTRLHAILFMDRNRREGSEFLSEPVDDADALAELLRHDFLGASQADSWRRFLQNAVALLARIETRALRAPAGVDRLVAAASRYISRTAS